MRDNFFQSLSKKFSDFFAKSKSIRVLCISAYKHSFMGTHEIHVPLQANISCSDKPCIGSRVQFLVLMHKFLII
jgi:hypothetical protein